MRMCIVVPVMGGLVESKPFWGCLLASVKGPVDLLIIDNAPKVENEGDQMTFFGKYIIPFWPGNVYYRQQEDNLGVPRSMQYAYEFEDTKRCDILAFIHNDLYIYDHGWDEQIVDLFLKQDVTSMARIGLVGLFGATGIHSNGGRQQVWNNMLEAEIHGDREIKEVKEIAVLDGLSMIASRAMLDAGDGVDVGIDIHHFYDLDLSLESLERGFRNFYAPIFCHHQSGQTACRPAFQDWANERMGMEKGEEAIYLLNRERWMKKWGHKLPYTVGEEPWPRD